MLIIPDKLKIWFNQVKCLLNYNNITGYMMVCILITIIYIELNILINLKLFEKFLISQVETFSTANNQLSLDDDGDNVDYY